MSQSDEQIQKLSKKFRNTVKHVPLTHAVLTKIYMLQVINNHQSNTKHFQEITIKTVFTQHLEICSHLANRDVNQGLLKMSIQNR